jgi:hypothetical protein
MSEQSPKPRRAATKTAKTQDAEPVPEPARFRIRLFVYGS